MSVKFEMITVRHCLHCKWPETWASVQNDVCLVVVVYVCLFTLFFFLLSSQIRQFQTIGFAAIYSIGEEKSWEKNSIQSCPTNPSNSLKLAMLSIREARESEQTGNNKHTQTKFSFIYIIIIISK